MGNKYTIFKDKELAKKQRGADIRFTMEAICSSETSVTFNGLQNISQETELFITISCGYNVLQPCGVQPTFRRDMWPSSSGSESKVKKKPACSVCCLLPAVCVLGFSFNPEGGGDIFLQNSVDFLRNTRCYT
jgi:hypothetical protein